MKLIGCNLQMLLGTIFLNGLILFSATLSAATEEKVYTFNIVPQFNTWRMHAIWQPILSELKQRTGLKFLLRGSISIPEFEKDFNKGTFDFVYMNPYHILIANKQQGYLPLIRDVGRDLYGVVVVRKDSQIKSIEDLQGKVVVFPAPNALGASLMIRAVLRNRYKITIHPRYVKTHGSVYLNVVLGEADAGGGVQKTLMQQDPEIRDVLRVLYETERVASHPISVHPRVPERVKELVKNAFFSMSLTQHGQKLLSNIPINEVGLAEMKDYMPISRLGLGALREAVNK